MPESGKTTGDDARDRRRLGAWTPAAPHRVAENIAVLLLGAGDGRPGLLQQPVLMPRERAAPSPSQLSDHLAGFCEPLVLSSGPPRPRCLLAPTALVGVSLPLDLFEVGQRGEERPQPLYLLLRCGGCLSAALQAQQQGKLALGPHACGCSPRRRPVRGSIGVVRGHPSTVPAGGRRVWAVPAARPVAPAPRRHCWRASTRATSHGESHGCPGLGSPAIRAHGGPRWRTLVEDGRPWLSAGRRRPDVSRGT